MGQPGLPGSQFPSEDAIARGLKDVKRDVQQLAAANPLGAAGIRAVEGGIVVEGSMDVQGAETVSGTLNVTGNATFSGDMRVEGTLSLPNGSVGNDALVNPLKQVAVYADADGFTLTPAEQDFCITTITVPDGFTEAMVVATGTVNGYNTNSSADYLWARVYINTGFGRRMFALMDATSGPASLTVNKQVQLTGLTGGETITCKIKISSQVANVTSSSNGASMNAFATFTR